MIPLRISLEGFMTYRDRQTFNFDGASLWVLAGPNGAGKSSVFDAITLALYNCHRAGKKNARVLINHHADRLIVEFDFQVGEERYRVRRTVPRKGSATRQAFYLRAEKATGSETPIPDTQYEDGFERWIETTIRLTYDTFIASVLLLQGQSTKLLDATTKERYEMIEEFVNLAAYKRLHELADDRRKQLAGKLKDLENQLKSNPLFGQGDLDQAEAASQSAHQQWDAAQQKVDGLIQLVEQSKHWKSRCDEIKQHEKILERWEQLINRSQEIREKYHRYQELKVVISLLQCIAENHIRINNDTEKIAELGQSIQASKTEIEKLTEAQKTYQSAQTRLEQLSQELTKEQTEIANQLAELAPQLAQLDQVEAAEKELADLSQQLEQYPNNVATLVTEAETKEQQLLDAKQALPLLKQLSTARTDLSTALQGGISIRAQINQAEANLAELQKTEQQLTSDLAEAEQTEKDLSTQVNYAEKTHSDLCQKLAQFEIATQQPVCELCGQDITPEHAEKERCNLKAKIQQAQTDLEHLKQQLEQAEQAKETIAEQRAAKNQAITELERNIGLQNQQRDYLQEEFERHRNQLREVYIELPESFQIRVSLQSPQKYTEWLETTYPTPTDLAQIKEFTEQLSKHQLKLKGLRKQSSQRSQLETSYQQTSNRLVRLKDGISVDQLAQLRPRQTELQQQQTQLAQEVGNIALEQENNETQLATSKEQVGKLTQQLKDQEIELAGIEAGKTEVERTLKATLEALPDTWQEQAQTVDPEALETLEQERDELLEYDDLHRQLDLAEQSIQVTKRQISQLKEDIAAVLLPAQRSTADIELELSTAKKQRETLQSQRDSAKQAWNKMQQDYQHQTELYQEQQETERQHQLCKQLSDLLGPRFLQAHLLRQAETTIVELANEILDGLSRGRLRLELQSGNAESGKMEALDLRVYDAETVNNPIAIALTSGSQRFRIAVSLALAIGRYAGQGERCVESVIIDEGFGGLDRDGRDDMINHLSELQQHLARIILVSHQEEFASAFTNGYQVQLINGSSQVHPLNFTD